MPRLRRYAVVGPAGGEVSRPGVPGADGTGVAGPGAMITPMTPDAPVSTALPDLRAVALAALTPAALDDVVQRILPGSAVTPAPGTAFGSSI